MEGLHASSPAQTMKRLRPKRRGEESCRKGRRQRSTATVPIEETSAETVDEPKENIEFKRKPL